MNLGYVSDCKDTEVVAACPIVRLRTWRDEDVEWYADLVADEAVMRFIGDGTTRDFGTAQREIDGFLREERDFGWSRWVAEREDGEPLGFVGFSLRDNEIDWGGRSRRKHWGARAIAAAGILAVEAGLVHRGIEKTVAYTVKENVRAWRINAAFGFALDGHVVRGDTVMVRQTLTRRQFVATGRRERNRAFLSRLCREAEPCPA